MLMQSSQPEPMQFSSMTMAFGQSFFFGRAADVAERVEDGLRRADDAAGAAVDAERRVDDVELVTVAGDGVRRAALRAGRTADAGLDNLVGQKESLGGVR